MGQLPLRGRKGKVVLIGPSESMSSPKKLDDRLFVETNYSAEDCVRRACWIMEAAGIDPETIRVEVKR